MNQKCPRCKTGTILNDGIDVSCINCGYVPLGYIELVYDTELQRYRPASTKEINLARRTEIGLNNKA